MDGKQPETYILNRTLSIPHQQGAVAIAEEAEVMNIVRFRILPFGNELPVIVLVLSV